MCDLGALKTYFSLDTMTSSTKQVPEWAIIVIAVMAGLVLLTGLVVLLVFSFTWFNRVR